jgi:uncharacterized protein DUF3291
VSEHMLVHLNVVRPVGAFSIGHPNAQYFFGQLPLVFARAKAADGMYWHNHGARTADGRYLEMDGLVAHRSECTGDNPHILTMAGWRDVQAMHRFAYREAVHIEGIKTLRDWVDRSQGPTLVMWWAPRDTRVGLEDAWNRLQMLRASGASPDAFTLQERFPAPS